MHIPRYSSVFPCDVTRGLSCRNFLSRLLIISSTTLWSTWEILRSSTCHIIVHCLPLIVLFMTHLSSTFSLKPQFVKVSKSSYQNRRAAWSVPYSAFSNFTYNMGLSFLFCHMYFLYKLGLQFYNQLGNSTL